MATATHNEAQVHEHGVAAGLLEIDPEGRVWRVGTRVHDRWHGLPRVRAVERKRAEHDTGRYLQVNLMVRRVFFHVLAHRLVWFSVHGDLPSGATINHKNGDTRDNRPGNLELASSKEQSVHMKDVLGITRVGARNSAARLTEEDAREVLRRSLAGEATAEVARDYPHVNYETIRAVVKRRTWRHL